MHKYILIIIFILILTIILQQLYFRTNNLQSSIEEGSTQNHENELKTVHLSTNFEIVSLLGYTRMKAFSTYSDIKTAAIGFFDNLSISRESLVIDKHFFSKKGLILESKDCFITWSCSIDVWKRFFNFFETQFVRAREGFTTRSTTTLNQMFYSSISEVVTRLLLGNATPTTAINSHLYKVTGTLHLFAISGFHLTFFISFVRKSYAHIFSKKGIFLCDLLFSTVFFCLVGYSPGLLRAFFMFLLSSIAWSLNRQKNGILSLFFSFLIANLIDLKALNQVGFQLSYGATLGILLYSQAYFSRFSQVKNKFIRILLNNLGISFAAQIAILPLVLYHFGTISLLSTVVTVFVSWLVPLIMQLGYSFVLFSFIVPQNILFILSLPLFFAVSTLLQILEFFNFDGALISVPNFSIVHVCMYYGSFVVFGLLWYVVLRTKNDAKNNKIYHFSL